jgi:hypothetical protein
VPNGPLPTVLHNTCQQCNFVRKQITTPHRMAGNTCLDAFNASVGDSATVVSHCRAAARYRK